MVRTMLVVWTLALAGLVFAPTAAATSPGQNGRIVFSTQATGSFQLYTLGPSGGGLHRLTHVSGDAVHPDWSPNGRWIVFELDTPNRCSIALMRANGSHIRTLPRPPGAECDGQPSFTQGGDRIVFVSFNPHTEDEAIWIQDLDGSHQHRLATSPFGGATDPNTSPHAGWLTFVGFNGQPFGQGLIRTNVRGQHPKLLLPYAADVAIKHDWAPHGHRIVFTNNADRTDRSANIGTITADGTALRWLTHLHDPAVRAYAGSYSPDGRWIAYRLENHGRYSLMRMHPDGSDKQVIRRFADNAPRFIDWGPTPPG
jgi:Tol biopolymer transport system component